MDITIEQTLALAINLSDYVVQLRDALEISMKRERALKEALDGAESALKNVTSEAAINADLNRTAAAVWTGTVSAPANAFEDSDRIEFLSHKIVTVAGVSPNSTFLDLKWLPDLHEGTGRTFRDAVDALRRR
jgi:hypothetical protein